jgi:hypothetical protein
MRKELEGNIYDKYGRLIGKIERCGRIKDKYGNYKGKIEKNGSIYDKYGNYAGRVNSIGDVYDRYDCYRGNDKEEIIKILEERKSSSGINWSIPAGRDDIVGGLFAFIFLITFFGSFLVTPAYWFYIGFQIDLSEKFLSIPTITKIWGLKYWIVEIKVPNPEDYKLLFIGAGISSLFAIFFSFISRMTAILTVIVIPGFNFLYLGSVILRLNWLQDPLKQWLAIKLFASACLILSIVPILSLFVKFVKK